MEAIVTLPVLLRMNCKLHERLYTAFTIKNAVNVSLGSSRDGTFRNFLCMLDHKDIKLDTSCHSFVYQGYFAEEEQNLYIRNITEIPGFVHIDVTNMTRERFNRCFPNFCPTLVERDGKSFVSSFKLKERTPKKEELEIAAVWHKKQGYFHQMDEINCIACCGWPNEAMSWTKRKRNWPSDTLVKEITSSAYHLLHKPSPSGDLEIKWEISFHLAESTLMDSITGPRLTTFTILKDLLKKNMALKTINVPIIHHLKTVFFWACERHSSEFWNLQQIEKCVTDLFDLLIQSYETGIIQHFFIPRINVLGDIPKGDLEKVLKELIIMKTWLHVTTFSAKPDLEAVALLELAWAKSQDELTQKLLRNKANDAASDLRYSMQYHLRCTSAKISDMASIACRAANMNFIDKTQLWYLEETLSCAYAIISACAEKMNSRVMAYKDLHQLVEQFCEPTPITGTEKRMNDVEFSHGYYRSVFEHQDKYPDGPLRNQFRIVVIHIMIEASEQLYHFAHMSEKISFLTDKIFSPTWSKGKWDLNILLDAVKPILPNFKWSDEGHLSIHQLAQQGVWLFQIPFDTLVQQKSIPNLSFVYCTGDCLEKRLDLAKDILCYKDGVPKINISKVALRDSVFNYAEGSPLENTFTSQMFHMLNIEPSCFNMDPLSNVSENEDSCSSVSLT